MKIVNSLPPKINKGQMVCLDVETFGQPDNFIHRPTGTFACLSIILESDLKKEIVYQIYDEKLLKDVFKLLNDGIWVLHNATYDLTQLTRFANINPRFIWDTMLVEQAMTGGKFLHYGLADLVRRWLGIIMEKDTRDEFSTATKMTNEMKTYAARDVVRTMQVALLQREEWEDEVGFRAYTEIDEKMIFPLLDMDGFRVDVPAWKTMTEEFRKLAQEIESKIQVNVYSGAQVKAKAKTFGLTLSDTKATTLLEFSDNDFIKDVLKARMYRKATSTYGLKFLEKVEEDGKIHCAYRITGAETGRMSSAKPNMQNIPVRKLPIFRDRFIPSEGSVIMVSDVSQQEPCILAYETKDDVLVSAIKAGEDLHYTVAKEIFGMFSKTDEDYSEKRNIGKTINLGTSYGLSEYGLATKLNVTQEEAARILRQYFTRFRGVFTWISSQRANSRRTEFVKTSIGRKIFLNPYSKHFDNNAINAPIQGGAADFTKMWVRKIWELCRKNKVKFCVVAIVHDEVVSDVPKSILKKYKQISEEAFQDTATTLYKGIPFKAETVIGKSWGVKQNKEELFDESEDFDSEE